MAFAARKLPDTPILIVTFDVPIEQHLQSLRSLNAEISSYMRMMSGKTCCVILDMRDLDLACSDFTLWIEEYHTNAQPFLDNPLLTVLAVGTQPVLPFGIKKIERQLRFLIIAFDTIATAIEKAQHIVSKAERV